MRVELEAVSKQYGEARALDAVTTTFEPGSVNAVIGLNGAGKTTLLQAVAGILSLPRGTVRLDGERFARHRLDLRRRFLFLPDFPVTFAEHEVLQHIAFVLRAYDRETGPAATQRVVALLEEFDLVGLAERRFTELSRGQVYKAALVALIACECDLWLLDEPFASGMDARGLQSFKQHAATLTARGGTVVFTTQIVETLPGFAHSVVVLERGSVLAAGPLESIEAGGQTGRAALEHLLSRRDGAQP